MPTKQTTVAAEYQKPSWLLIAMVTYYFISDGILPHFLTSWRSSSVEVLFNIVTVGILAKAIHLGGLRRAGARHVQ